MSKKKKRQLEIKLLKLESRLANAERLYDRSMRMASKYSSSIRKIEFTIDALKERTINHNS